MAVTIYSYGNLDALTGIFNAIVMVMGGNDYKDAIRIAIMLGFGIAAINAATQQHRSWQWVVTVIVMYQILFVPKTTAVLQDRTGTAAARSVSNVPYALGFFAQLKSSIGWVLTSTFETGFQTIPMAGVALPSQLSYSKTGLMFGGSLIRVSRGADFVDPDIRSDIVQFFQNCTVPDLMDGTIPPAAFFDSSDLWTAAGTGNPSRFSTVHTLTGLQNMPCPSVRSNINGRLPTQLTSVMQKLGSQLYPALPAATAVTEFTSALPSAYTKYGIATAATSASDLIRQNAMVNLFAETGQLMNLSASDPAAVMMSIGLAQGVASTNASYMTQGRIAEQALPIIKNTVEAIIYSMFPVIVLLMLMSEGEALKKTAKSYLYAMLWVELWPVLYAVVNFIGTTYSAANVGGAATLAGGGKALALNTASQVYTTAISDMAVVGWMTLSIPVIAGAVVWSMDKLQSAVNMGAFLGAIGSNTGQAAQGNVGLGNTSFEQQRLDPNRSSANMRTMSDAYGTTVGNMQNGYETYSTNVGSYLVTPQISKQTSANFAAQSAVEQSEGQMKTKQANESITAAFNDARNLLRGSGKDQQLGDKFGFGKLGNDGLSTEQRDQVATQLAKDLKIQDASRVTDAMKSGLSLSGLISKLSPLTVGADGQKATDEQISAAVSKARNHATQLSTANMVSVVDNFSHSQDFANLTSTNQRAGHNIQSSLDQAKGYMKSASVNFSEAQRYQERAEKAVALSSGWSGSDTKAWGDFLAEVGVRGTRTRQTFGKCPASWTNSLIEAA
jgi:conjugal transfer mating pair stabilization protein TraG